MGDMGSMTGMNSASSNSTAGMDMSMAMGECQISMLWNWYTVDACFLSSSWHVKSHGQFVGSWFGVFLLCMSIEFVRRLGREYDRKLISTAKAAAIACEQASSSLPGMKDDIITTTSTKFHPSWMQQIIRSIAYGAQFTAAFLAMLLGMYFNGYILFAIFLGQTIGYFVFGSDTCSTQVDHVVSGSCC